MARPAPKSPSGRKRQLNIIYFVDSARTKSLSIPLRHVKLAAAGIAFVHLWSLVAVVLIIKLNDDRLETRERTAKALATLFEYESRYDDVFERAYSPAAQRATTAPSLASAATAPARPSDKSDPSTDKAADSTLKTASDEDKAASLDQALAQATNTKEPAAAPKAAPANTAAKASAPSEEAQGSAQSTITVSNPVLEPHDDALELNFDLTNKSTNARAEGYVWAVAELKTDQGDTIFVGAPSEIEVDANGEPKFPERSAGFAIRYFKKKKFVFPIGKNAGGSFVGIRIGVMSRGGKERTTYKVPVDIRISKNIKPESPNAPKSHKTPQAG